MSGTASDAGRKVPWIESFASHLVVILAVAFALYPVLWVIALAFSGTATPEAKVLPIPSEPTFDHLWAVISTTREVGDSTQWLFGRQLANSLIVSIATALVGIGIAIPAAYALARFDFVGKEPCQLKMTWGNGERMWTTHERTEFGERILAEGRA